MMFALRLFALAALAAASLSPAATAERADVRSVRQVFESIGVKKARAAILSGQPMLSGELQGLGFVAGLRRCEEGLDDSMKCEEVALKSCLPLAAGNERIVLLEAANRFNLNRYAGKLYIDTTDDIGAVACTVVQFAFDDENSFGLDEAYIWSQALTDFRSFLEEEGILLRDPSAL